MLTSFTFDKCHSLGNDFVIVMADSADALGVDDLRLLADRHRGVGFDQLMWVWPAHGRNDLDYNVRIFNSDGSESGQCMNGLRCVGYLLQQAVDPGQSQWAVLVWDRIFTLHQTGSQAYGLHCDMSTVTKTKKVTLDLGSNSVELTEVDLGNPHAVWLCDDIRSEEATRMAAAIGSSDYFSRGVNVEVCSIGNETIDLRVLERGAGWTQACGSGAMAAAIAARQNDWINAQEVTILQPGGELKVTWLNQGLAVRLSGHVAWIYRGEWRGDAAC